MLLDYPYLSIFLECLSVAVIFLVPAAILIFTVKAIFSGSSK